MTDAGSEPPNIEELVRRAQQNDEQAFSVLYTTYRIPLNTYLSKKSNNNWVAEDLAQDALLKAWRNLPALKEPAAFKGWLYQIATRCFLDQQKRWKRLSTMDIATCQENNSHLRVDGPEDGYISEERLNEALAMMNDKYRACLLLYSQDGKSKAEIAHLLGIQESSVDKYLSRARKELRSIYALMIESEKHV